MAGSTWLRRWRAQRTERWRARLGVEQLEAEVLLFKLYVHEGVVGEPGRTILKMWRAEEAEKTGPPPETDEVAMAEYKFSLR